MPGRWLKVAELLTQPRLAEVATYAGRFHTNSLLGVLKDEPVAMQPSHHAVATADAVQVVPASQLGRSKSGGERLSGPACEAVDPVVRFVVRGPLWDFLEIAHSGLKRRESELSFEDTARGEELLVIPSW